MSAKYLLNVSITPVQEFIAEARKTRDLWIGSYLLSFITFKALEPFINNIKCEIIYPAYKESPFYRKIYTNDHVLPHELQVASLPNHFLVVVPENELDKLVMESKNMLKNYWNEKAQEVKDHIKDQFNEINSDWDSLWADQIKDHWQYMWIAVPVSEDELNNNYRKRANEIQIFLEERKLTRTFKQWVGSSAIKCIQCGHREVLGPRYLDKNSAFWKEVRKQFGVKIRKNEKLCSICIIKRFLKSSDILTSLKEPDFESTEDIAVIPYKNVLEEKLDSNKKNSLIKAANELLVYLHETHVKRIDQISGNLLYLDELSTEKLVKEYFPEVKDDEAIDKKKKELIQPSDNLKKLLNEISKEHNTKPSKYYAVLFMDGDNIGKWLSGVLPEGLSSFTLKGHQDLSTKLGNLGVKVMPEVLRSSSASPIYSGGDDLLALSPLDNILNLALELREKFSREGFNPCVTTSSGIVIAHYSEPFKKVLEEGRRAVGKAKERMERNAFWMTLILSSGTFIEGGYKWYMPQGTSATDVLSQLATWIKDECLSTRFIYDVFSCLDVFYNQNNKLREDMFKAEIERLFLRHWDKKKSPVNNSLNEEIKDFINNLSAIANSSSYRKEMNACDNVRDLLRITNFIAKEYVRWE